MQHPLLYLVVHLKNHDSYLPLVYLRFLVRLFKLSPNYSGIYSLGALSVYLADLLLSGFWKISMHFYFFVRLLELQTVGPPSIIAVL